MKRKKNSIIEYIEPNMGCSCFKRNTFTYLQNREKEVENMKRYIMEQARQQIKAEFIQVYSQNELYYMELVNNLMKKINEREKIIMKLKNDLNKNELNKDKII
jgi:uncharacterized protein YcaQ